MAKARDLDLVLWMNPLTVHGGLFLCAASRSLANRYDPFTLDAPIMEKHLHTQIYILKLQQQS